MESVNKDFHNFQTTTKSTDDDTTLDNFPSDKGHKVDGNILAIGDLRDLSCDVCNSDDHKGQMGVVEEPPKQ